MIRNIFVGGDFAGQRRDVAEDHFGVDRRLNNLSPDENSEVGETGNRPGFVCPDARVLAAIG